MKIIDYGKRYVPHGTTDFMVLAASDNTVAKSLDYFRRNVLLFPSNSIFTDSVGNISVGLLGFPNGYLFVQIQSRREDELNPEMSTMRRPFAQIRFTLLLKQEIVDLIKDGKAIYTSLLYNDINTNHAGKRFRLPDFGWFKEDKVDILNINWNRRQDVETSLTRFGFQTDLEDLVNFLYKSLSHSSQDNLTYERGILDRVPREEIVFYRLALLEKAQAMLYPFFPDKIITYALDNITSQRVTVRFIDR